MNCGDRRLIIMASALIAVAVVGLVALLAAKSLPIPAEAWMVVMGVVSMFGGIFSHRQAPPPSKSEENDESKTL